MVWENTKLFLKLYYRPLVALSSIIDEGSWIYAAVLVIGASLLLQFGSTNSARDSLALINSMRVTSPELDFAHGAFQ